MVPFAGKIGVIGAGAVGGYYGACLARAGFDVHLLMRSDYNAAFSQGLVIHSVHGDFTVKPPVYQSAEALGACDLILIGLKMTHNQALAELLAPTVGPQTVILTLQNGLGSEEMIAATLEQLGFARPQEQIIGGVAFICSSRSAPAVIEHTAHGSIRLAEMTGAIRERTRAVAAMWELAGVACEVNPSLAAIRWEKLLWNIPFSGMSVAGDRADTQVIMNDEELLATVRGLIGEVIAAAHADGVTLDPAKAEGIVNATRGMGPYHSSMQIDAELGRPLEVEAILGEPLRRARRAGIDTPRLQMLYGLVRRLDQTRQLAR